MAVGRHANDQDAIEDIDDAVVDEVNSQPEHSKGSLNPDSSGGDLVELSSNASVSRGMMSSLGDITEGNEELESEDAASGSHSSDEGLTPDNLQTLATDCQEEQEEHSHIRRVLSQAHLEALATNTSVPEQSQELALSMELSLGAQEAMGSLKNLQMETLAEKLHRSFGGLLELGDYTTSLQKNELADVQDLVRTLDKNAGAARAKGQDVESDYGTDYGSEY